MSILSLAFVAPLLKPADAKPQPKPKPYTLEHLIAWLETMPADRQYDWFDARDCPFGRYGRHVARHRPWLVFFYPLPAMLYQHTVRQFRKTYGSGMDRGRMGLVASRGEPFDIAIDYPFTFGAALSRARDARHILVARS